MNQPQLINYILEHFRLFCFDGTITHKQGLHFVLDKVAYEWIKDLKDVIFGTAPNDNLSAIFAVNFLFPMDIPEPVIPPTKEEKITADIIEQFEPFEISRIIRGLQYNQAGLWLQKAKDAAKKLHSYLSAGGTKPEDSFWWGDASGDIIYGPKVIKVSYTHDYDYAYSYNLDSGDIVYSTLDEDTDEWSHETLYTSYTCAGHCCDLNGGAYAFIQARLDEVKEKKIR